MCLSQEEKKVINQVTYTSANTKRKDGTQMNQFTNKIAKAIQQDCISYQLLNN